MGYRSGGWDVSEQAQAGRLPHRIGSAERREEGRLRLGHCEDGLDGGTGCCLAHGDDRVGELNEREGANSM